MKKIVLCVPLAAFALLGGCAGSTPAIVTSVVSPIIAELLPLDTQIASAAKTACGFQPVLADVDTLIGSLFPAGGAAALVINTVTGAICSQVTAAQASMSKKFGARYGGALPTYVTVDGVRVNQQPQ